MALGTNRTFLAALATAGLLVQARADTLPPAAPPVGSPLPGVTQPLAPKIAPPLAEPAPEAPSSESTAPVTLVAPPEFAGVTVYPQDVLQAGFAPLAQGTTTLGQIQEAVRQLQLRYRQDGYFLTTVNGALVPAGGGGYRLRVQAVEGYIGSVKIAGEDGPSTLLIFNFLNHLVGIRPLKVTDLEHWVLLASDIPGITIQTILRQTAGEPGAIELVAKVERKAVDVSIEDDNRGPKTAGPNQMVVGVSANSFTSLGERTQLVLYDTPFDDEELFGQASTEAYIGDDGLKARAYLGYGILHPGDVLAASQIKERMLLAGIGAEYPLMRTRALSLKADAALDFSSSTVDLFDDIPAFPHRLSESNLRILRIGATAEIQDTIFGPEHAGANLVSVKLHQGIPGLFGGTPTGNGDTAPARAGEINDFFKLSGEARRTQGLYAWGDTSLSLGLAGAWQWTDDLLPPTEKFYLGGIQFGRGFYYGEVTGDRAVAGSLDLRLNDRFDTALFGDPMPVGMTYYAFFDTGRAWNLGPFDLDYHLSSIGLGVQADLADYVSIQVEGVDRLTRRPTGGDTIPEPEQAVFFTVRGHF